MATISGQLPPWIMTAPQMELEMAQARNAQMAPMFARERLDLEKRQLDISDRRESFLEQMEREKRDKQEALFKDAEQQANAMSADMANAPTTADKIGVLYKYSRLSVHPVLGNTWEKAFNALQKVSESERKANDLRLANEQAMKMANDLGLSIRGIHPTSEGVSFTYGTTSEGRSLQDLNTYKTLVAEIESAEKTGDPVAIGKAKKNLEYFERNTLSASESGADETRLFLGYLRDVRSLESQNMSKPLPDEEVYRNFQRLRSFAKPTSQPTLAPVDPNDPLGVLKK